MCPLMAVTVQWNLKMDLSLHNQKVWIVKQLLKEWRSAKTHIICLQGFRFSSSFFTPFSVLCSCVHVYGPGILANI